MSPPSHCNFKKGPWTPSEDALLLAFVKEYGQGAWSTAHSSFEGRLQRCGRCCRLRYLNQLRKGLGFRRRDTFTPAEERIIFLAHGTHGKKWATIALMLAGRTDNDVKNFWNIRTQSQRLQRQAAFLLAPADSSVDEPAFSNISPSQAHLLIINSRRHEAAISPFSRTMAALHRLTTSIPRYHNGDVLVSSSAGVQLPSVQLFSTSAKHDGRFAATGCHKGHPLIEAIASSEDDIPHDGFFNQEHGELSPLFMLSKL